MTRADAPAPQPRVGREAILSGITTFLASQAAPTLDDIRAALEREIDEAGPDALASLGDRLAEPDADWDYYASDPLARRLHQVIADRLLPEGSLLDGVEHVAAVAGKPVVIFANHLSYSDANLLEILLQRSGGGALADRLTAMAGPKVYSSRKRRFSSLCFGTIKTPQSTTRSSEDAVMRPREVAHAARRMRCRKGSANLRVTVEGRGAHAGSGHREGANAIVEMARLVEHMAEMTDYSRDLTVNVGSIAGGGPSNRVPHQAECSVNIRAFDESVLQSAIDAIFSLRDGPAAVRAKSDGFSCRISVELLSRNPSWRQNPETDALIEVWMRSAKRIGRSLLAESRGGLSDGNYLSQFLPSLDGLGPFGLRGHSSERSSDGSKVPEYVATSSFLEMGAINVAAIRELMSA